jgi:YidC/Oxa1 family membrane protein insertase
VKILTLPLTTAQLESTTKIQKLAPMQKKIQEVYAEDEATKNQMVAQLFQAAKVNPLAGCLPALVQIPVFISLYRALTNLVAENKLGEAFLWIPSLEGPVYSRSAAEAGVWIKSIFGGNPLLGWHDTAAFLSLPLILFVSQTISQKLLQPPRDPTRTLSEQEEASQAVINYLPLIVAFFSINVPAGLSVYWIVNNILTTVVTVAVKNSLQGGDFPAEVAALMSRVESSVRGKSGGGSSSRRSMGGSLSSDPENSAASRPKPAGFGASSRASSSPKMEKAAKTLEEFAARRQAESSSASASSATDQEGTII